MKIFRTFLWMSMLLLSASGCKDDRKSPHVNQSSHNKLNSISLLIAGMQPDSFAPIPASWQRLQAYRDYCDSMNSGFSHIDSLRLGPMREWAKGELPATPKVVFYPFSGPDILHCVQFYPDADEYILMALERYGSLPDIETMDSSHAVTTLSYLYKSLGDIFFKGYFVTRNMLTDISNPYNGVIPVACISLVRSGYSILDFKYKHLADDGKAFGEIPQDSLGTRVNDCVEIYFRKKGKEKIQKLIYFRTNLADDPYDAPDYFKINNAYNPNNIPGLRTNKGLKAFLDHLPPCCGYIKSASYLMFQGHFTLIRQVCLDRCRFILEDDTGIPFHCYQDGRWTFTLYGRYEKPISLFHGGYYQADLARTYLADSVNIRQLPFSLGYHWQDQVQNLMKFEKTDQ